MNEVEANRYYIDCEFDGHNGPLLSMAIVRDDDDYSIHMRIAQEAKDPWVRKNVMPLMDQHKATQSGIVYINDVGGVIRAFIDTDEPTIIADSPVDIGRFCAVISTGADGGWASADYPFMRFEVHNVDCYPTTLEGAVQHNAWWDAMALRAILEKQHDAEA